MAHQTIAVLTFKSKERILGDGGTQSWKLKPSTAEQFDYVVCTRNATTRKAEGPEPHRSAFLVGRITEILPSTEKHKPDRYRICFEEYADACIKDAWKLGWRNPLRYTTLEELGIDVDLLTFKKVEVSDLAHVDVAGETDPDNAEDEDNVGPLTIMQAKEGLSLGLGVPVDAIEITVKF